MMKARVILMLIALAMVAFGMWSISRRGSHVHRGPATPARTPAEVPIQNGKTLDFSSGKAVVKDSPAERAQLEKSVAEMDAAAGNVTFPSKANATPSTTAEKKP